MYIIIDILIIYNYIILYCINICIYILYRYIAD